MTAGRWDENPWTVEPGADSSWEAEWKDANGAAVDITNYTAALQIRDFYDQTTALISLTSSPAAGIVFKDHELQLQEGGLGPPDDEHSLRSEDPVA
jgi:hypothetical protein